MIQIPPQVAEVFAGFIVAEYAYITRHGDPLCWPVTPYWDPVTGVLSVSTGLAYPTKALHAKRNPKVAMYFSDPTGTNLTQPPVLVQGDAEVRDQDIQANTDRYVVALREKFPVARIALNPLTVKALDFYLPRLWVDITPRNIEIDPSMPDDEDPPGEQPEMRLTTEEAGALIGVTKRLGEAVVTIVGADGYPRCLRTQTLARSDGTVLLGDAVPAGKGCLTFHSHSLGGTRFKAWMARGWVHPSAGTTMFVPHRLVGFFGNGTVFPLSVLPRVAGLRSRLKRELARRGQPMPRLRIPR